MASTVCRNRFVYATLLHHRLQLLADAPIVHLTKYRLGIFLWIVTVAFDNLKGHCQQFHLIGYTSLMTLADNPFLTIDLHDVVRSQFLQVHKRQGGEVHEHEEVTHKGEVRILKLMRHYPLQFLFSQKGTLLALGTDMELCKHVALYLAVVMGAAYDSFQVHTRQPDGGTGQTSVIAEIDCKLLDEVGGEFLHGYISATEIHLKKVRYVVSQPHLQFVCTQCPVLHVFSDWKCSCRTHLAGSRIHCRSPDRHCAPSLP